MDKEKDSLFKYIRINQKNEIDFVSNADREMETLELFSTTSTFEGEIIGNKILNYINKFISKEKGSLKCNQEQSRVFSKLFQSEKEQLNISVRRFLTTDYKDTYIFSPSNITDIVRIL